MSDENKRLVYTDADSNVCVVVPAPGFTLEQCLQNPDVRAAVDAGTVAAVVTVDELPADRLFRPAWKQETDGSCVECPVKTKDVAHDIRRAVRAAKFAPHDELIAKQIPGMAEEAEAQRQVIRDADAAVQVEIDACTDVAELRAAVLAYAPDLAPAGRP